MAEIKIKSNGLRNELKEIRLSIDKLTEAILQQTNKRYEKANTNKPCANELCKCQKNKDGTV
jgi:hypothetical protein